MRLRNPYLPEYVAPAPFAMLYVSAELWADRDFMLEAMKQDGSVLRQCPLALYARPARSKKNLPVNILVRSLCASTLLFNKYFDIFEH